MYDIGPINSSLDSQTQINNIVSNLQSQGLNAAQISERIDPFGQLSGLINNSLGAQQAPAPSFDPSPAIQPQSFQPAQSFQPQSFQAASFDPSPAIQQINPQQYTPQQLTSALQTLQLQGLSNRQIQERASQFGLDFNAVNSALASPAFAQVPGNKAIPFGRAEQRAAENPQIGNSITPERAAYLADLYSRPPAFSFLASEGRPSVTSPVADNPNVDANIRNYVQNLLGSSLSPQDRAARLQSDLRQFGLGANDVARATGIDVGQVNQFLGLGNPAPAGLLSDSEKRSAPSEQPALTQSALNPSLFLDRLGVQLGRLNPEDIAPFQTQLASAIQDFPNRPRGDINYNFQRFTGTSADDQGLDLGTFDSTEGAPKIPGLSDREAAYAAFLVNQGASVQGTTAASVPLKLLDAGFSATDVKNILATLGVNESAGSIDEAIADAAARDFMAQTGLKADTGNFRGFIKDAFNSPVGAFILAGLTGGLGGLGAIGSGLAGAVGGTLSGAAASALGGAAIGGLGAGLGGNDILKGAALGGIGGGISGSGIGDSLGKLGGAAVRGGLSGGLTSAVNGGDVLQGLLGGAVQGGATAGLSQLGNSIRGGLLGNSFADGIDFNDIEPNSFPPQEGDTFNDTTDYFALTAENLRATAEAIVNDPNSTPAQIEQAIADYERAVELGNMASQLNTDGAFRVDIKGANTPGLEFVPQLTSSTRPVQQPLITAPGKSPFVVDIKGAETPKEEFEPVVQPLLTSPGKQPFVVDIKGAEVPPAKVSGGADGFQQVPIVAKTPTGGGLLSDAPAVSTGGGGLLSDIADQGEIARDPVKEVIAEAAKNPNLNISDLIKLLALLGGGAAAIKGLTGGGGGGSGIPTTSVGQRRYRFNPVVSQYPGDLSKYGETDIGDFKFYRPGLLTD